jgi:hypothetical protein
MLVASADNVVFVNFHRDNKNGFEPFGIQELFQKIYIYFIKSEDYINSNEKLDDQNVKKQAERLRAQAKEMLLSNKVWGGVVGIIPGVDWLLQKFVIKKNAAKKLGQIYGIDSENKRCHQWICVGNPYACAFNRNRHIDDITYKVLPGVTFRTLGKENNRCYFYR